MKKLLLSVVVLMMLNINAYAVDGTIDKVRVDGATGEMLVYIETAAGPIYSKWLVGTAEAKKAMYATVLTAKSTGANVSLFIDTIDGANGWSSVIIQ